MIKNLYILFLLFGIHTVAQNQFPIKIRDFSEKYEAVINRNEKDTLIIGHYEEYIPEYVIVIIEKATKKTVLETYTANFPTYLLDENNEAIPNIKELPYGSQSVLLYEDYNFDGAKDFALMNGNNSCYSGPSFDIYLAKNNSFEYSESFSTLSNDYCGMFQIDQQTQTLHTMTKSGCCWLQFSEFKVVNNEPKIVKIVEEGMSNEPPRLVEVHTEEWKNNKKKESNTLLLPYNTYETDTLLYFDLNKSNKKVVLFKSDEYLYYALLKPDETIEFYYPQPFYDETKENYVYGNFTYDSDDKTLKFKNKDAEYILYETDNSIGIKILTNGKTYDMKGNYETNIGSLTKLRTVKLLNVLHDNY